MVETKVSWITRLNEDTLRVEYKTDCYVDVEEYEENMRAYRSLMKTEKVFLLTIANQGAESSLEVRNIFSSAKRSSFKMAEAFVISSLAQKILANYVIRIQKPKHPLRFFNNEKEARSWLNKQKINMAAKAM